MKTNDFDRYSVSPNEDFEGGSNEEVLKNELGIKSKETIEKVEEQELKRAELELLDIFDESHQFTAKDVCNIHQLWLGDVYSFAGKYRAVNLVKDNFSFAAADRIPALMKDFERGFLAKYTPCNYHDLNELAYALGVVHVELILIHPFREGNGRAARLLADLMVAQAKRPPLDYLPIDQIVNEEGFRKYILAIHAGLAGNYGPITEVFKLLLNQTTA